MMKQIIANLQNQKQKETKLKKCVLFNLLQIYFIVSDLKKLPISNNINWNNLENGIEKEIIEEVGKILELKEKLNSLETPTERKMLQKQIDILDNKINENIFNLYKITPNEIKIIEEKLR